MYNESEEPTSVEGLLAVQLLYYAIHRKISWLPLGYARKIAKDHGLPDDVAFKAYNILTKKGLLKPPRSNKLAFELTPLFYLLEGLEPREMWRLVQ